MEFNKVRHTTKVIDEKITRTILIITDKELIQLIKKDSVVKCETVVYETNYKDIYIFENNLDKVKDKDATDIKLTLHINTKM